MNLSLKGERAVSRTNAISPSFNSLDQNIFIESGDPRTQLAFERLALSQGHLGRHRGGSATLWGRDSSRILLAKEPLWTSRSALPDKRSIERCLNVWTFTP